jgi:aldose 1-epimerase
VSLRLDFGGDENWPWPFLAEQEIEIGDESLLLKLSVTNLADETVPLSFGHHPYFDAKGAMLQFSAKHFYPNAEDDLPADPELPAGPADFSKPRPVLGAKIDNVYDGWDGFARIEWQDRLHALEISTSLSHAVLYTPVDADFFCFEPLPHLTNALNRVDCDVPVVGPGECTATQIDFRTMPKVIKEY